MPASSQTFQFHNKGTDEEFVLLDLCGLDHLDVPLHPEIGVKKQEGKQMCDCVTQPEHTDLYINYKDPFTGK
ncbi:MAG: hypothetical protein HRT57_10800 [Crocinitomicaceae bacterium]|nr:hypothetical protein [Crocinitomicaceae bacterium]